MSYSRMGEVFVSQSLSDGAATLNLTLNPSTTSSSTGYLPQPLDAVELIDKDGLIYLIGSQKSEELARVVYQELNKK